MYVYNREMKLAVYFLIVALNVIIGNSLPLTNITIPQADSNVKSVEFNLTLPNNDILKVNISFVMMKESKSLETRDNGYQLDDNDYLLDEDDKTTTTTTTTTISSITTEEPSSKYFTVDEAIEAFRKTLINKESNIGGILEAEEPFYRHFNLKYDNVDIPIRCTYDSAYEKRQLKINCFEYREFEQERILSNGEIEKVRTPDLSRKLQNIEIIDLKNYNQTYKMDIS